MLPTIPFKKHTTHNAPRTSSKKGALGGKQNAMQRQSHSNNEHVAKNKASVQKTKLNPWLIVVFVLVVAVAGIAILRLSRAAGGEPAGIPVSMFDIQNKVTALVAEQPVPTGDLQASGYTEFHYAPVTDQAVSTVVYYLDNVMVSSSTKSPYSFVFDTSRKQNDSYTLTAVAFDATNTPVAATQRTIVINNTAGILQSAKNLVTYPWYALFNL